MENRPTPGIISVELTGDRKHVDELFTKDSKGVDMKLCYMDLQEIHEFSDLGKEFFDKMAETKNYDLFETKIIQNLIDFKWPIIKRQTLWFLFAPFVLYLFSTVVYTSYLLHKKVNNNKSSWIEDIEDRVLEVAMFVFSLYFIGVELLQLKVQGFDKYFTSVWNIVDIVPPCIIISIVFSTWKGYWADFDATTDGHRNREQYSILMSLASLCLWIKFFYFLRIFETFGFLVLGITAVISEIFYFLVILMISFLGFGDSYKVISNANSNPDDGFGFDGLIGGVYYTYLIGVGEFQGFDWGSVATGYVNIIFILLMLDSVAPV